MSQGVDSLPCLPKTAWPLTFICELALQNPNINFIAIDRADSILLKLSKKLDLEKLENIRIILLDASKLSMIFI